MNLSELDNCELGLISKSYQTEGNLKVTILKTDMTINEKMYVNHPSGSIVPVKTPIEGVAVIIHNSDGSTELRSYTPDGLCLSPTYLEHSYNLKTVEKIDTKLPFVIVHKKSGNYLQIRDPKGFSTQKTYHWVPELKKATISPLISFRMARIKSEDVYLANVKVEYKVELIEPDVDATSKSKGCVCCHAGEIGRAHVRNFPIQAMNAPDELTLTKNAFHHLLEEAEQFNNVLEEVLPEGFPKEEFLGTKSPKENWKCTECGDDTPCSVSITSISGEAFCNKFCLGSESVTPKWVRSE